MSHTGKRKERPARKQAEEIEPPPEEVSGGIYNIWYHKTAGDYSTWRDRRELKLQGKKYRCDPERDSGITKARKDGYVCLFFARGKCVQGSECTYYHRIPTEDDELRIDMAHDVFGRERHRDDREDMGGVGSFERNNKTLYIGGLKRSTDQEKVIRKHFGVFGEIVYLRVIHSKSIAFVQYKLRTAAEFAKEAMADQTLDGDEVLNVRWANEDPNPSAKERHKRDLEEEAARALQIKFPEYWEYYSNLYTYSQYPNTDHQYPQVPYYDPNQTEYYNSYGVSEVQDQDQSEGQNYSENYGTYPNDGDSEFQQENTVGSEYGGHVDGSYEQSEANPEISKYYESSADYYSQYRNSDYYQGYLPQFLDPKEAEKRRIESVIQQSLEQQQKVEEKS